MVENFEKKRKQSIPTLPFKIDFEKLLKVNETPVETPLKVTNSKNSNGNTHNILQTEENLKFKTMPCKYFHSNVNYKCGRGDTCDFIHDYRYEGRELPVDLYLHKRQHALERERNRSTSKKRG